MNAIVVRDQQGKIVCMGPDNGMYDPRVPSGCTKAVEDDYDIKIQQHLAELGARPQPPTLDQRVKAIEDQLAKR